MQKYDFSIRTRSGQLIEHVKIMGQSQEDAERKLNQMYHHCEVVRCGSQQRAAAKSADAVSMENLLSMITK